jgi:glycosyltransferase involved in cell wall biosynthesis
MSQSTPASLPVVIALATAWGPKLGGINAFNAEFIKSLGIVPGRAFRLLCLVQEADEDDLAEANRHQIELLAYGLDPEKELAGATAQCAQVLKEAHLPADTPVIFIGHDDKTGPLALALKKSVPDSKAALIHHMAHGAYQSYKKNSSKPAQEKAAMQQALFGAADVCLAVGPLLTEHLEDLLCNSPSGPVVHMLVPGLDVPAEFGVALADKPPNNFTAFVAGRLSAEDDRIKQGWLALRGFGRAVKQTKTAEEYATNALQQSPRLRMRGVEKAEVADLAAQLLLSAGREVAQDFAEYTADRKAYYESLASASVVLMPSWHEGFGLVAWEAIACALPVVIGQQSGVYRLLHKDCAGAGLGQSVMVVNVDGHTPDENGDFNHTEEDVDSIAKHLVTLGANIHRAKTQAQHLRTNLLRYDWKSCADSFLDAVTKALAVPLKSAPVTKPPSIIAPTVPAPPSIILPLWLQLPTARTWQPEQGLSPSNLLLARDEIVPFDPVRAPELTKLIAWAENATGIDIQLVTGAGGSGKTRLGYELGRQLQKNNGWHSLWLGRELSVTWAKEWEQLCQTIQKPVLLVIDYAEARQAHVLGLLQHLLDAATGVPVQKVRILLLARGAAWWQTLHHSAHCVETVAGWLMGRVDGAQWELPPWRDDAATRHQSYKTAMSAYATVQGLPETRYLPRLSDPVFSRPLYLHLAALAALVGQRPATATRILEVQLHHEWLYWLRSHGGKNSDYDDWADTMAWLALRQGASSAALTRVLGDWGIDAPGLVKGLRKFYPMQDGIAGLQPDLLAECLLRQRLAQARGAAILALALADDDDQEAVDKVLDVIGRLSAHPERAEEFDVLPVWRQVLVQGLAKVWPVFGTTLVTVAHTAEAGLGALLCHAWAQLAAQQQQELAGQLRFPSYSSNLLQLKPMVRRIVLQEAATPAERAGALSNLAVCLAEQGDPAARAEVLECARESVKLCRELARTQPAAYLPKVALSLNNLANHLSEQGDAAARTEALECARESLSIRRELAQTQPAEYLPHVALSLNNLANHLSEQGDAAARTEALECACESVNIYRELDLTHPAAYLPDVAMSLNNLANRLSTLGDAAARAEALECARESLSIQRELAQTQPAAYLPDVAMSLNNLANHLAAQGDEAARADALECAREAVTIYFRLHRQLPAAFETKLNGSIRVLGKIAVKNGLDAEVEKKSLLTGLIDAAH